MDLKKELDRETNAFAKANNDQLNAHNEKVIATENIVSLIFREVYGVSEEFFEEYVRDILWNSSYMEEIVKQRNPYEYKEYIKEICCFISDLGDYVIDYIDEINSNMDSKNEYLNANFKDEYLKICETVEQYSSNELYQIIFEKFNKDGDWVGF